MLNIILIILLFVAYILPGIVVVLDYFYDIYKEKSFWTSDITRFFLALIIAVVPIINWVFVVHEVKWFKFKDFEIISWDKEN